MPLPLTKRHYRNTVRASSSRSLQKNNMADRKKRTRNYNKFHKKQENTGESDKSPAEDVDESSPVIQMFRACQRELDEKHDRHERIVKLSRDITIESKRIIFTLHRVIDASSSTDLLTQTEERLTELENTKFHQVAKELVNTDAHQFLRAYTGGLQEYIEALSFLFFLKDNALIPVQSVRDRLTFKPDISEKKPEQDKPTTEADGQCETVEAQSDVVADTDNKAASQPSTNGETISVMVPFSDYILGIADLTGEMMRRAINSVGDGDLDRPFEICAFLQEIESAYSSLNNCNREVNRKLTVLRQSLRKVETACYTLKVRGSEIPKHMLVDVISKSHVSGDYLDDAVIDDV